MSVMGEAEKYDNRVNKLREITLENKLQLSEQDARILGLNELIERVRDTITDLENELEEAAEAYEELKEKHHMLTSSDAESSEKILQLTEFKQNLEERIKELGVSINDNKAAYEEAIKDQKKLAHELNELQDAK